MPRPFRIAVCLSYFHPTVGGAERQLFQLAERWARWGHEPLVLTRRVDGLAARQFVGGIEIRRVIRTVPLGPLFGLSFLASLVANLIRFSRRYDVLLAGQAPWEAVAAGFVSLVLGKPSAVRIASTGPVGDLAQLRGAKASALWRMLVLANRCFLAPSARAREELGRLGCIPARVKPVTNGVDNARFRPAADADLDRHRTVLFAGRLAAVKNPLAVLRAWKRLNPRGNYRLLLAGDGPLADSLKAYRRQESLANVEFLGHCDDMPPVYQRASVCVHTSPSEGCSNALLEAMACGLCPVATRVPGNVDVIEDGTQGLLVNLDDEEQLARALATVLDDGTLRQRLAGAARMRVLADHDLDRVAADYLAIFADLLEERS